MAYLNKQHCSADKGEFSGAVCFNKQLGQRICRVRLEFSGSGATVFAQAKPGQFAQLDLSKVLLPSAEAIPPDMRDASQRNILLRRPFSFSDVSAKRDKTSVEIIYCVVGPASLRMTTLSADASLSVIGPLGNGFSVPQNKKIGLLVAGGMGAGPLLYLAKALRSSRPEIEVTALVGARTAEESLFNLPLDKISNQQGLSLEEFRAHSVEWVIDDGPAGHRGFVTELLESWLAQHRPIANEDIIIYSCGPEEMLAGVAEIARERKIDCQLSMERRMACGIGVCQSCAVECKVAGSKETVYKLCCKDGPVFDSREVVFSQ